MEFDLYPLNKPVFSFLCMLTTWHSLHSPAVAECQPCSNQSISPAHRDHSRKPTAAGLLLWAHDGTDRQTDGQMDRQVAGQMD